MAGSNPAGRPKLVCTVAASAPAISSKVVIAETNLEALEADKEIVTVSPV